MTSSELTSFDSAYQDRYLFVTGCYRSGTTLTEKLLHGHADVCVASQPFPILYFYVKEAFLKVKGLERRYPLDHRFIEDEYSQDDFDQFLCQYKLTRSDINAVFDRLADYKLGLWTPSVLELRDRVSEGTFWSLFREITGLLSRILDKPAVLVRGVKEVLCEEYIPYMVSKGTKVVVVIRDPRDMIASLDFRDRDNSTGDHRPILYSLRAWRKSVAYALTFEHHANVMWLRYEDLVTDVMSQLSRLTEVLGIQPFKQEGFDRGEILGQDGQVWTGNSSFSDRNGVSTSSVGRFQGKLPTEVIAYVEAVCGPEMACLGYETFGSGVVDETALLNFHEPFENMHAKFPLNYSRTRRRVRDELHRLALLSAETEKLSANDATRWFISERAYIKLRELHDFDRILLH